MSDSKWMTEYEFRQRTVRFYRNHPLIQCIKDKTDFDLDPFSFPVGYEDGGQKTSYSRNMPWKF